MMTIDCQGMSIQNALKYIRVYVAYRGRRNFEVWMHQELFGLILSSNNIITTSAQFRSNSEVFDHSFFLGFPVRFVDISNRDEMLFVSSDGERILVINIGTPAKVLPYRRIKSSS